MSVYRIYKNGVEENRIVADEAFCQEHYSTDGYSYELEPAPTDEQMPPPTELDHLRADVDFLAALQGVEL